MELTRRDVCVLGVGLAGAALVAGASVPAFALSDATQAAIAEFTGGATPAEGGVELGTPEIAENGNTVPIEVAGGDGCVAIMVVADGNPNPGVATFRFGELAGARTASTRMRLAKTQTVIAVAKNADGSFGMASRLVKVTIGGCGG